MSQSRQPAVSPFPFSRAVVQQDLIFISGQIGLHPSTGKLPHQSFGQEVLQVMLNIGSVLSEYQVGYNNIVNVTVYLTDIGRYDEFNRVYRSFFKDHFPARVCVAVAALPAGAQVEISAIAARPCSPKTVIENFLKEVRSGLNPGSAGKYMADTVLAHQITSENPQTVVRTPTGYAEHVREFLVLFGRFDLKITELLADGDKVYVRWEQKGIHQGNIDEYKPTGLPLLEYTSVVYRVRNGKIVEYWLQSDRAGFEAQLKNNQELKFKNPAEN